MTLSSAEAPISNHQRKKKEGSGSAGERKRERGERRVILRTTPHWSVRMTSCNFRLLTWEQQIKITFAAWVRTNNKFQIIIMGHGDSLSYFILSCLYLTFSSPTHTKLPGVLNSRHRTLAKIFARPPYIRHRTYILISYVKAILDIKLYKTASKL